MYDIKNSVQWHDMILAMILIMISWTYDIIIYWYHSFRSMISSTYDTIVLWSHFLFKTYDITGNSTVISQNYGITYILSCSATFQMWQSPMMAVRDLYYNCHTNGPKLARSCACKRMCTKNKRRINAIVGNLKLFMLAGSWLNVRTPATEKG